VRRIITNVGEGDGGPFFSPTPRASRSPTFRARGRKLPSLSETGREHLRARSEPANFAELARAGCRQRQRRRARMRHGR
jgi:hypothetical protein